MVGVHVVGEECLAARGGCGAQELLDDGKELGGAREDLVQTFAADIGATVDLDFFTVLQQLLDVVQPLGVIMLVSLCTLIK